MLKLKLLSTLIGCSIAASSFAMTPQPDPLNPTGYIISAAEVKAAEEAKTADPMYKVWAKALATRPNSIVEAIEPALPAILTTSSGSNVSFHSQTGIS